MDLQTTSVQLTDKSNLIREARARARAREARSKCKNYPGGGGGGGTCRIERGEILAIVNKICRKIRFKVKDDFLRNESSEHGPRRMRIRLNTPRYTGRRMPQVYHMGSAKALSSPPLNATMVLLSAHTRSFFSSFFLSHLDVLHFAYCLFIISFRIYARAS